MSLMQWGFRIERERENTIVREIVSRPELAEWVKCSYITDSQSSFLEMPMQGLGVKSQHLEDTTLRMSREEGRHFRGDSSKSLAPLNVQ